MATPAFELKGTVSTLTVLRLRSTELAQIDSELGKKVAQLPHFFLQAPVVVDVTALEQEAAAQLDLAALAALLRQHKLVPVAATGLGQDKHGEAAAAGLGLLKGALPGARARTASEPASSANKPDAAVSDTPAEAPISAPADGDAPADGGAPAATAADSEAEPTAEVAATAVAAAPPSLLIRQPVRGGQVVFSPTDLVVLGPVNAGAEVIADGNIHVYGRLSGRALAGAHGDEQARIFCANLDAELVSVAGEYRRADELPSERRGNAAQIFLGEDGALVIDEL